MADVVATRYAKALIEAVASGPVSEAQEILRQLEEFRSLVASSRELNNVMLSPAISTPKKKALADRLGERLDASRLVRNFLKVVIDHRRMGMLRQIVRAFESLLDERMGIMQAEVVSARPIDAALQGQIESGLSKVTGKTLRSRYGIDEHLIGGVVATVGSTVYDGSVRGQLDDMRRRLFAAEA